ncbi:hypothetical protein, partial [Bordetella petrii]|uniref:hypothetical protein n=1 Tax=Bordetella petrii TaxID=94624 RepID=UPI001E4AA2D4
CRRAAPRQKAPLGGSKPKAQRGGFFLPPGRPKAKSPLGGQQAEGAAWGLFLPRIPPSLDGIQAPYHRAKNLCIYFFKNQSATAFLPRQPYCFFPDYRAMDSECAPKIIKLIIPVMAKGPLFGI